MTDQELADRAGIPLRILLAIRAVESGGSASAVRFEPHVFHARTGSNPTCRSSPSRCTTAQIRAAARPDYLSRVPWTPSGQAGRPSVSLVGSETNRAAFERAFRVDPEAAVRATSWGSFQILGGHLLRIRGPEPAAAVAAFDRDPTKVGEEMFLSWMRDSPAAQAAAQRGDIETLARIYNGSQRWAEAVRRALARIPEGATAAVGGLGLALALGLGAYVFVRWQRRS